MSEQQQSATGSSATTPATDTATEKQIQTAVAQVKEARAKEAVLKGKPDLAKIFREEKAPKQEEVPAAEAATEPEKPAEAPPAEDPAKAAEKAAADKAAAELEERKSKRREELAALAKSGREKWQAKQQEKQEAGTLAKQKAELEAVRKQIEDEKAQLELAKKDPFKFLEKLGVPPEELARRVIQRGDPKQTAEEVRAELEAFKKEQLDAAKRDEEARVKRAEEDRRAAAANAVRQSEQRFVSMVTSDDKKYSALNALYTPQEILMKAHQVVAQIRANDPDAFYDDSEIADYLEQEAAPRLQKLRGPTEQQAPQSPEKPAASVAQPEAGQKSRTLTSDLQSEGTIDLAAFKKLPRAKQNQILGELLKNATGRKGAK